MDCSKLPTDEIGDSQRSHEEAASALSFEEEIRLLGLSPLSLNLEDEGPPQTAFPSDGLHSSAMETGEGTSNPQPVENMEVQESSLGNTATVSGNSKQFVRLNGAGKKRLRWLVQQGVPFKEAVERAKVPYNPERNEKRRRSNGEPSPPQQPNKRPNIGASPVGTAGASAPPPVPTEGNTSSTSPIERDVSFPPTAAPNPVVAESELNSGLSGPSFADSLNSIKLGIADARFPDVCLSNEQFVAIQAAIIDTVIAQCEAEGPKPSFTGVNYRNGWLVVHCKDEYSVSWLKDLVAQMQPWQGASLRSIDQKDFPRSKLLVAYFPDTAAESNERIFKIIKGLNTGLDTSLWRTVRRAPSGPGSLLTISVDSASFDIIKSKGFLVAYKFGMVHFKSRDQSAEQKQANSQASGKGPKPSTSTASTSAQPQPSTSGLQGQASRPRPPSRAANAVAARINRPPATEGASEAPRQRGSRPTEHDFPGLERRRALRPSKGKGTRRY